MPSNYKILVNGQLTDADDVFELRENYPLLVDNFPGGPLYAWGKNSRGQLGHNDIIDRSSPVQVGTDSDWKKIEVALSSEPVIGGAILTHTCALKTNNTLWCWGYNVNGRLGLNDSISRSSPVQVGTDVDWADITTSARTMATKTDGTLWSWGSNANGQLGHNDIIDRSSPVQIGTDTNWGKVGRIFLQSSGIIKTNGTLWSWGRNNSGQLGHNDIIDRSSPVQVGTDSDWKKIYGSSVHIVAIKTDGTLWSWGSNTNGQLGHNDTISRSSPVQVGTDTDWKNISVGNTHVFAIKTNGTLWSWGPNSSGQLGQNDTISRSSPVQVGTDTNWKDISAGISHTLAIKTNGTLWSWGSNSGGELGQSIVISRSSPVQVGTNTDWKSISTGQLHSSALTY